VRRWRRDRRTGSESCMCLPLPSEAEITLLFSIRVTLRVVRNSVVTSPLSLTTTTVDGSAWGCRISSRWSNATNTRRTNPPSLFSSKAPRGSCSQSWLTGHCSTVVAGEGNCSSPMLGVSTTRTLSTATCHQAHYC